MHKLALLLAILFSIQIINAQPHVIDSLQKLIPSEKNDTTKARLYLNIATTWSKMNPDTALFYAKQSANIFSSEKYNLGIADAELLQARIKVNVNQSITAIHHYKNALELYIKLKDTNGEAASYSGMGVAYGMQEKFPLALTNILKSLKIYERNKNLKGVANAYMKMGVINTKTNEFEEALVHYNKALSIAEQSNDLFNLSAIHMNIGSLYGSMEDLNNALIHLKKSKAIGLAGNFYPLVADAEMNIGNAYRELKQYDSAQHYYLTAQQVFKKLKNLESLSHNYNCIAELHYDQKQYAAAHRAVQQSLAIARDLDNHSLLYNNYELLVMISKAENNYKATTEYYSALLALKDSVFNDKRNENLQRIRAEFQQEKDGEMISQLQNENTEKTKQQNRLRIVILVIGALLFFLAGTLWQLYKRNRQLKKRKQQLQEINLMKDKFLSIISHDLRSPLANILSLLHVISEDDKNKEHAQIFDRLKITTSSVLETMDNMLAWGKNYFSNGILEKNQVNLGILSERVCRFLKENANNKEIQIQNKIPDDIILNADENQLEFIMRNLVSNAIKFSHEKSLIELSATKLEKDIKIHVKDYGKGMHSNQQLNLFDINKRESTKGTAGETGSGLGLFLSNEFIALHGGKLDVKSEPDKGTEFIIMLPAA